MGWLGKGKKTWKLRAEMSHPDNSWENLYKINVLINYNWDNFKLCLRMSDIIGTLQKIFRIAKLSLSVYFSIPCFCWVPEHVTNRYWLVFPYSELRGCCIVAGGFFQNGHWTVTPTVQSSKHNLFPNKH